MRRLFSVNPLILIPISIFSCGLVANPQEQPQPPAVVDVPAEVIAAKPSVLIVPLVNASRSRDHNALAFGLPVVLAERMENDPNVESLNGPLVFTEEQAKVAEALARDIDLTAAFELAKGRNADYVMSGTMRGHTEDWTFVIDVYRVTDRGLLKAGTGTARGNLTVPKPRKTPPAPGAKPRRPVYVQSSEITHQLFAKAAADAFASAGIPLAEQTLAAVAAPSTKDAYAFLLYSRALARYFHADTWAEADRVKAKKGEEKNKTPLAYAEHAVRVDPSLFEARRHYAMLLRTAGNTASARIQVIAALERRPKDVRALAELGSLELAEGNPKEALAALQAALTVWPMDAQLHYLAGRANDDMGQTSSAEAAYAKARDIDPEHVGARRALVAITVDARRYAEAAEELRALVRLLPNDERTAFLLAASLRAAGKRDEAIASLAEAAERFPGEERFHLFRGDLLREKGEAGHAGDAYDAAFAADPRNARAAIMAADAGTGEQAVPLGGKSFLRVIEEEARRAAQLDGQRSEFTLASNDALLELTLRGSDACTNAGSIGSTLLAQHAGNSFWSVGRTLHDGAAAIRGALEAGEGAALTPDEERMARAVLTADAAAARDAREMLALYRESLLPAFNRKGCGDADGELVMLGLDAVRARNNARPVTLPEVPPPAWSVPVGPVVPPLSHRLITFYVDNTDGPVPYVLTIDGEEVGTVAPGKKKRFTTRLGPHALCVEPADRVCGEDGTLRHVLLHENFVWRVRPVS